MAAVTQTLGDIPYNLAPTNATLESTQFVRSVQFFAKSGYISGVKFNGIVMGETATGSVTASDELFLDAEEYISSIATTSYINGDKDNVPRSVLLTTTKGRSITFGTASGTPKTIPVLSTANGLTKGAVIMELNFVAGRTSGGTLFLSQIMGKCCNINSSDGTNQSNIVASKKLCVIGICAPFTTMKIYKSSNVSRMSAMSKVMERQFDSSFSASTSASASGKIGVVKMRMTAQVAYNTNLSKTDSTSMKEELNEEVNNASLTEREVPEGYVGLEVVTVDCYEDTYDSGDGKDSVNWMWPTSQVEYILVKQEEGIKTVGVYDLTGALSAQIPAMAERKEENHDGLGFDWYNKA